MKQVGIGIYIVSFKSVRNIKQYAVVAALLCIFFSSKSYAQLHKSPVNFGVKAGLNYSLIGTSYSNYVGSASPQLSGFLSYRLNRSTLLLAEPGYSGIEFRQQQNDTRYTMDCIDLSFNAMFYTNDGNSDLAFILGVRPSFLIAHSTLGFQNGSSIIISDPANTNKNGQLDIGLTGGLTLNLSPIVNLELLYNYSLTNYNSSVGISGRPSTLEMGLRINAFGYQNALNAKQQKLRDQVNYYKSGVLLVMLPSPPEASMKAISEAGNEGVIPIIRNAYYTNNQIVMSEFRREFTFCPVYFFSDNDAYKVAAGKPESVFVNGQQQIDSIINIDTAHFFVASVCTDLSQYTQRHQLGLYVYDEKLNQLGKPFNPNLIDFMSDGNPINYLNGKKVLLYNPIIIRKKIRKLNSRLLNLAD